MTHREPAQAIEALDRISAVILRALVATEALERAAAAVAQQAEPRAEEAS